MCVRVHKEWLREDTKRSFARVNISGQQCYYVDKLLVYFHYCRKEKECLINHTANVRDLNHPALH